MQVHERSEFVAAQEQVRGLTRTLLAGTSELRKQKKSLLPQWPKETTREYENRWKRSVLYPFYIRAVRKARAAVFSKPITLRDDVPVVIRGDGEKEGWWDNVDLQGNDGTVFLGRVFQDSVGDAGVTAVFVDHSRVPQGASQADLDRAGLRPRWVHVPAARHLDFQWVEGDGGLRLTQFRFLETYTEQSDDWTQVKKTRVRVLRAAAEGMPYASWETWSIPEKVDDEPELIDNGTLRPHTKIPVALFYTGWLGTYEAEPPFLELAHMVVLFTQKRSDLDDKILNLDPIYHRAGIDEETLKAQREKGLKRLWWSPAPATEVRAELLEPTGSSIETQQKDLDLMKAEILAESLQPHVQRTGDETATGRFLDTLEATTEVQAWAIAMKDFTENLLALTMMYRGEQSGGTVEVHHAMKLPQLTREELDLLLRAKIESLKAGDPIPLSWEEILRQFQRHGLISEDYNVEEEAERLLGMELGETGRMLTFGRRLDALRQQGLDLEQALEQAEREIE